MAAAACVLVVGGGALAGCAQKAAAAATIQLGTAYVEVPSSGATTAAYLVIRNRGPVTDRLVSVRTSVGGRVTFREPVHAGRATMKTVPDIGIPGNSLVRLSPDGSHLLITDAGPMKGGTEITLTLVFAKGGTISVPAEVTNPESGGSSYFVN
jgi:hypothetical protein